VIWAITCSTFVATGAVEPTQGHVAALAGELVSGVGPAADQTAAAATRMTAAKILISLAPVRARLVGVIDEEGMHPPGGSFRLFPACPGTFR
jgi:hypothetical protein